jgi:hypothetical protein
MVMVGLLVGLLVGNHGNGMVIFHRVWFNPSHQSPGRCASSGGKGHAGERFV